MQAPPSISPSSRRSLHRGAVKPGGTGSRAAVDFAVAVERLEAGRFRGSSAGERKKRNGVEVLTIILDGWQNALLNHVQSVLKIEKRRLGCNTRDKIKVTDDKISLEFLVGVLRPTLVGHNSRLTTNAPPSFCHLQLEFLCDNHVLPDRSPLNPQVVIPLTSTNWGRLRVF